MFATIPLEPITQKRVAPIISGAADSPGKG
jgi:hypothetical protein